VSCVWLLKRQIAYRRETIFQRGCEPLPTIFFFAKKKKTLALTLTAKGATYRNAHFIFDNVHSLLFPRGSYFRQSGFLTKRSMTDENEITDVFVFERDIPTLPPKQPAREARVRVLSAPELRSSWFWGGGDGDASPARPRRKTTGNRPRACCYSPLPKGGGGPAGAGPSGVENEEEEAKGRLGRGRASLTRNEAGSARMGLVLLFIQCTHGRASD
jgi:hypothetical protein